MFVEIQNNTIHYQTMAQQVVILQFAKHKFVIKTRSRRSCGPVVFHKFLCFVHFLTHLQFKSQYFTNFSLSTCHLFKFSPTWIRFKFTLHSVVAWISTFTMKSTSVGYSNSPISPIFIII